MTTPAGWHPDPQVPGQQRYWDGSQWTDQTAPIPAPPAFSQPVTPQTGDQRPWFKKKRWIGAMVVVAIFGIAAAAGGGSEDSDDKPSADPTTSQTSDTTEPTADETTEASEPEPPAEPEFTRAQENAIQAAKDYLDYSAFSRKGLIQQLSSAAGDGYKRADAEFAVDHIKVNWRNQAVQAGQDYLDYTSFSRQGLIEQLSSDAGDGYTRAQATYAADKLGM